MPPRLPPRLLPVLYFSAAHVALIAAFTAIVVDPRGVAGFFYHSRMLGIVHLVTLGWITASILGSLYLVGPIALRVWVPATAIDYVAFVLVASGIVGMVAHFWLERYAGMAWSASTVATGIVVTGVRVIWRLRDAAIPRAVTAHIVLAFANIAGAAVLGILIGFDKAYHFLPGFVLANVFAHAHLAAIGWAAMMVVGVAYRVLPMVIPAQMPSGPRLWVTAILLEAGIVGLFITLLLQSRAIALFAVVIVTAFGVFLWQVGWMLRRPRPRPPGLALPDPAMLHAGASFAWLACACALGLWLSVADTSPASLHVAMAYGVFGLVGFLAQIVVGMEGRLLPLFAWYWAYANSGYRGPVPSPHQMPWRGGQEVAFVLWLFGVPALAGGLALDAVPFVAAGALTLLAAAVLDAVNLAVILRHAFTTPAAT